MGFVQRVAERFAARDVSRNVIGSPGCETYQATIGTAGFTVNNGSGPNTSIGTVDWVWHDPTSNNQAGHQPGRSSSIPRRRTPPTNDHGLGEDRLYQPTAVRGLVLHDRRRDVSRRQRGRWQRHDAGRADWHLTATAPTTATARPSGGQTTLPPMPSGTVLRYKVGVYRTDAGPWFPFGAIRYHVGAADGIHLPDHELQRANRLLLSPQ